MERIHGGKVAAAAGCLVAATLAMTGCSHHEEGAVDADVTEQSIERTAALEGRTWVLTAYGDPSDPKTPVEAGKAVTAIFDRIQRRVAGNASCNRYFAEYATDGNTIEISKGGSTRMACLTPELADQERVFLEAIEAAETFTVVNDTLRISCSDGRVLVFVQKSPGALESTEWMVTGYNNGSGGVVSVISGTELTARFVDGTVAGNAGCNDYRCGYDIDGSGLRIGSATATKKMCAGPGGVMEQEAQFLAALTTVATHRIDGDVLELRREDGALAVQLTARD